MNMRIHMNKKLAVILFLVLLLFCMQTEARRNAEEVYKETVANQARTLEVAHELQANNTKLINEAIPTPSAAAKEEPKKPKDKSFFTGLFSSFTGIFFVEFGDRTFMLTVLFTMKHDRCKVFFPAIVTMVGMHLMSVAFGTVLKELFPTSVIIYFSVALFLFFGCMMLYEAYHMRPRSSQEKLTELEHDLVEKKDKDAEAEAAPTPSTAPRPRTKTEESVLSMDTASTPQWIKHTEMALPEESPVPVEGNKAKQFCANPYMQLVLLLFLADWGDRCQLSAIVFTAKYNIWGVAVGGALVGADKVIILQGMALCVFLAVLSGAFLTNLLTEKVTTYIAGILFIVFGFQPLICRLIFGQEPEEKAEDQLQSHPQYYYLIIVQ